MKTKEKDPYSLAKLIIDAFGPILTFAGIIIGISNFNSEQKESAEKERKTQTYLDAMEFKRKNWEKQHEIYIQIAEIIGKITNGNSEVQTKEKDKFIEEFQQLYYGKAAFVEDDTVAANMRKFHDALEDYRDGFRTQNDLKSIGFELIAVCKASSKSSWNQLNKGQ